MYGLYVYNKIQKKTKLDIKKHQETNSKSVKDDDDDIHSMYGKVRCIYLYIHTNMYMYIYRSMNIYYVYR